MNLMFRKNFREGGGGGSGKSSGGAKMSKVNRSGKRSRDMSMSAAGGGGDGDFTQYRTHIFFNANRGTYQDDNNGGTRR